jgi:hypothetical protein
LGQWLEHAFAPLATGDVDGVIAAVVAGFAAQPKLCELTSIASPVQIQHERSADACALAQACERPRRGARALGRVGKTHRREL